MNRHSLKLLHSALIGFILTFAAHGEEIKASSSDITCPVNVYMFFDVSMSLGDAERSQLIKGMKDFLQGRENNLFPPGTNFYLVPFAGSPANALPSPIKDPADLDHLLNKEDSASIYQSSEMQVNDNQKRTDLSKVVTKILNLAKDTDSTSISGNGKGTPLRQSTASPSYSVFIIASDFEHDPENKPDDVLVNEDSWKGYFDSIAQDYYETFSSRNRSLLLLRVKNTNSTPVSKRIVHDLGGAGFVGGKLQVVPFDFNGDTLRKAEFLALLEPIDVIISRRSGSFAKGNPSVTIQAYNRSCLNLGSLEYQIGIAYGKQYISINPPDGEGELKANKNGMEWSKEIKPTTNHQPVYELDSPKARYKIRINLTGERSFTLGEAEARTRAFLFISTMRAIASEADPVFNVDVGLDGDLTDLQATDLSFTLKQKGHPIAHGKKEVSAADLEGGSGHVSFDFFNINFDDFEHLCYEDSSDTTISISGPSSELMVQDGKSLPVWVDKNIKDNSGEFLRELFEQASFPALLTAIVTLFFLWRHASEAERVEKVMALTVVMGTTVFVALHHLTKLDEKMDQYLVRRGGFVAAVTIFLFALLVWRLIKLGGLPFSKTDSDLLSELALERDAKTKKPRVFFWRWALILLVSFLALRSILFLMHDSKEKMECILRSSDYTSHYAENSTVEAGKAMAAH